MDARDYLSWYHNYVLGYEPEENTKYTIGAIEYMIDSGLSKKEIFNELLRHNTPIIKSQNLSDELWNDSLLEKSKFYFHRELQIVSKAPIFDIKTNTKILLPFFIEIKIKYTIDDIINYYYRNIPGADRSISDINVDRKTISYLLNLCKNVSYGESIDMLLLAIDFMKNASNVNMFIGNDIFSLKNYLGMSKESIKNTILEAKVRNADKIIWRYQND